jgi:hypothetical protein
MDPDSPDTGRPADAVEDLCREFRHHVEGFYASLRLAPPYHSIEKAVIHLNHRLKTLEPAERAHIAKTLPLRWAEFTRAFAESGLNQKHRGIIAGLAASPLTTTLPEEYKRFLATFSR